MEWISVDENLPQKTGRVLVTLLNQCVCEVFYINNTFKHPEFKQNGGMREVSCDNPVIAWQPLPKPYKIKKMQT